jgi:cell pole-organizing protein PopZ
VGGVDEVGLSMTQPAKAQEPSMEEILASIRRIIADDEAKPDAAPPAAQQPQSRPQAEPAMKAQPKPLAPAMVSAPAPKPVMAKPAAAPPPPPPEKNSQDDIDAMLAGLDADTTAEEVRPAPIDDVFELTEQMAVPPPQPSFRTIDPQNDIEFSEPPPAPEPVRPPARAFEERVREQVIEEVEAPAARPLMSHSTFAAVDSAFNSLAQTVLSNNARTLEDLVKEMLRPMLKTWLDDNLPNMVEKIVRAEIERVSRGR